MPYPEMLVAPMRAELTNGGFTELKSADEVVAFMEGNEDTTLVMVRLLVIRFAPPALPLDRPDSSRFSFSLMLLPSLIWGVIDSVRPTSLRSMVWNGLTEPEVPPVPVLLN
mgnify:CR=1 FL=1